LVPFFVPRDGTASSLGRQERGTRIAPYRKRGFCRRGTGNYIECKRPKGELMYIGGGVLTLIVVILLLVWLF
jgi:hypothetical protein